MLRACRGRGAVNREGERGAGPYRGNLNPAGNLKGEKVKEEEQGVELGARERDKGRRREKESERAEVGGGETEEHHFAGSRASFKENGSTCRGCTTTE